MKNVIKLDAYFYLMELEFALKGFVDYYNLNVITNPYKT